jgi:uncharacterized Zn ribbon protein
MRVSCDPCGIDMKLGSSFRYYCPECRHEIEIQHIQEKNREYRDEHGKNIEWIKIRGEDLIVIS